MGQTGLAAQSCLGWWLLLWWKSAGGTSPSRIQPRDLPPARCRSLPSSNGRGRSHQRAEGHPPVFNGGGDPAPGQGTRTSPQAPGRARGAAGGRSLSPSRSLSRLSASPQPGASARPPPAPLPAAAGAGTGLALRLPPKRGGRGRELEPCRGGGQRRGPPRPQRGWRRNSPVSPDGAASLPHGFQPLLPNHPGLLGVVPCPKEHLVALFCSFAMNSDSNCC